VIGRLRLIEGGQGPVVEAAKEVQEAHRKVILARAQQGSTGIPAEVMRAARGAEQHFVLTAQQELSLNAYSRKADATAMPGLEG
jgi:hypothetical protein